MKSVGLKIRNIREQKNIKQSYIAGKLNIHTSTYCQIENGNIELTLTRLTEIIKILQIGYIDVLPDTPEVYIPPPPQPPTEIV